MLKAVGGLLIAIACVVMLYLTHMDRTPELPPTRPLTEPTYEITPIPETTTVEPTTGGYVDDSTIDVREG